MKVSKRKFGILKYMFLIVVILLIMGKVQVYAAETRTITITKDRQQVDKFCDVKSYYILGSSNTGNYCCAAYVKRFYAALYGVSVSQINTYAGPPVVSAVDKKVSLKQVSTPQPGDIMQNTGRTHVAIVKSVSGNEVTLIEQNWKWTAGGAVYAKINRKIDVSSAYFYRLVTNGKEVSPAKKASQPKDRQVWLVSSAGGINLRSSYSESASVVSGIPYNTILNITKKKTMSGGTWGQTEYNGKSGWILLSNACYVWGTLALSDNQPPVISNVKVSKISASGYTVTCTVSDNVGVARVQFPTWTSFGGQDDLASDWIVNPKYSGTISGNKVTFQVKRSEHNREFGIYNTHIYAFDAAGNSIGAVAPAAEVGKASGLESEFYAYLQNKSSGKYVTALCSYAQIGKYTGTDEQLFKFTKQSDGYYTIESVRNGKALYIKAAADGKGSYVKLGKAKKNDTWRWRIYGTKGAYVFRNKTADEVMMLTSDKFTERNKLRMNGQKNVRTYTFNIIKSGR